MIPYKVVENEGSIVSIDRLSDSELRKFESTLTDRTKKIFRKYGSFSITPIKDLDENGVVTCIVDMSNSFELLPPTHYMHRIITAIRPYLRDEIIDQII